MENVHLGDPREGVILALLRHGQTEESTERRFAGWNDVELTERGFEEAYVAGSRLRGKINFDVCHTSYLRRAIDSANWVLNGLGTPWLPVLKHWRLNERHMGDLTGCLLSEIRNRLDAEQWRIWEQKRDLKPSPPANAFAAEVQKRIRADRRYAGITVPESESNEEVFARVLPCWTYAIAPRLSQGENTLVVAHSNVLGNLLRVVKRTSFTGPPKSLKHCDPIILRLRRSDLEVLQQEGLDGEKATEIAPAA